ncbi:hypothetical protein L1987_10469 [Smallanthus sonchifolius]|uniref:Uncharacterized protein n=1 Tax=Smallanthus sonchifolius TaxID=185202 RepID=A0ACB9JS65_9ASTR|nr:hypothetical protein L1987_10469 [Smallanthus sonchifolius]
MTWHHDHNIPCCSSTDSRLSIFKHPSQRLFEKGGRDIVLTNEVRHKAHTYILLNCQELHESVWLFDEELRDSFPNYDKATLDEMKEKKFSMWLQTHVMNVPNKEHLRGLAQGPLTYAKSHKGLEEVEDMDADKDEVEDRNDDNYEEVEFDYIMARSLAGGGGGKGRRSGRGGTDTVGRPPSVDIMARSSKGGGGGKGHGSGRDSTDTVGRPPSGASHHTSIPSSDIMARSSTGGGGGKDHDMQEAVVEHTCSANQAMLSCGGSY